MKRNVRYTVFGFMMLITMSISLVFSTLHSHHHIEWDHPADFADTGNCITKDTTVCPISGYLYNADIVVSTPVKYDFPAYKLFDEYKTPAFLKSNDSPVLGRAPPALA